MVTSSGCCTSPLTTYSRKACMRSASGRHNGSGGFVGLLDKAGHRIARLSAFAQPVFGPLKVHGEIGALLQRLIGPQFLDELPIPGAPAVGYDYAEDRGILGPDPLHTNFNGHKLSANTCGAKAERLRTTQNEPEN